MKDRGLNHSPRLWDW